MELPEVQPGLETVVGLEKAFGLLHPAHLVFQEEMKLLHGLHDGGHLMEDEVGQVVVVRLRVEKGFPVLDRGFFDDAGDGDELHEPIALAGHHPIEEGPGRSAVAVHEGVVAGQHEVNDDGADHGVNELPVPLVGKVAQGLHPLVQLPGIRRGVNIRHLLIRRYGHRRVSVQPMEGGGCDMLCRWDIGEAGGKGHHCCSTSKTRGEPEEPNLKAGFAKGELGVLVYSIQHYTRV